MCGFLGEFVYNSVGFIKDESFADLLRLSKHRGPDDTQIIKEASFRLGFNRLSILDVSKNGSQPKSSPSKRYHVVFNGEIYNYKELEETHNLINLKSSSDTEVLVHLLDIIGVEQTINSLNGMFAIMIVDTQENNTYLVRDFAGIKPIFYGLNTKGLVAASQFNQIVKHPWFFNDLNLRAEVVKSYFGLGYMLAPDTIYDNIFQVEPGQYIKIDSNGQVSKNSYYTLKSTKKATSIIDTDLWSKALENATNLQLVSDVPLGSFLSGGIDSPLITAIAKKYKPRLKAFTLGVSDKTLNEADIAKLYADHMGCEQKILKVNDDDIFNSIEEHFHFMTEPFGDYSSIPTYMITHLASKENKVMLSGDGGDELFLGYPRMLRTVKLRHWFKIPFAIRKPLARIFLKMGFLKSWAPYHYKSIDAYVLQQQSYISASNLTSIFPKINYPNRVNQLFLFDKKLTKNNLLNWIRLNEFRGHLQRVLVKVDRMSMANSLEVRVPFLDINMIDSCLNYIPEDYKSNEDLKKPLKALLSLFFPENIINKEKKGFAIPIEDWLKNELKIEVIDTIFNKTFYGAGIIQIDEIKSYVDGFFKNKHNEAWGVWHIYAWQKWALKEGLI
ncbi:asparagine synthase (glutamine-hydrolyzing) [Winogradskyella sp.]|uniref:asparagine synthase (glutamine-hydrolyzing) n=1 Tax=Winogradskyella sp. TaxID=1883156 RepID=UPI0035C816FF